MREKTKIKTDIRQRMEQQGGTLTVDADSPYGTVLAHMHRAGDVELVARCGQQITYRWLPLPHPYQRRDVVIWTRTDGTEYRARVVGVTRTSIRIFTQDDGMVRNVDPGMVRYAYDRTGDNQPARHNAEILEPALLDQAIIRWLDARTRRSCSTSTRRSYLNILLSFRAALHAVHLELDSPASEVAQVARDWARQRYVLQPDPSSEDDASPATFNQRLSLISSFYKFALQQQIISGTNPIDLVERQHSSPRSSETHSVTSS